MIRAHIRLDVGEDVIEEFKDSAKAKFPRETYAILLGRIEVDRVQVTELYVPADVDKHCHTSAVNVQQCWGAKAKRYAKAVGLVVLGDIHSHPYEAAEMEARRPHLPDASPSEGDLKRSKFGILQGICLVTESNTGKLRSRVRFWGAAIHLVEVI
jgi:hypothetical protein